MKTSIRAAILLVLLVTAGAGAATAQQTDTFDAALARGAAALREGDTVAARSAFEEALAISPGHPAAQSFLGNALLADNEVMRATELLEAAVAGAADYYPARLGLGRAYLAAGRTDEGISQLRTAARLDPADTTSRTLLAQTLLRTGRNPEARDAARALIAIAPQQFGGHYLLAAAELQEGAAAAALEEFDEALKIQPEDPGAGYGRARALLLLQRNAEAREQLSVVLDAHRDHADSWFLLGEMAATEARSFDGLLLAAQFYQEGLVHRPADVRATLTLADLQMQLGLFDSGRELLEALPATATATPAAQVLLGRLAAGAGDHVLATAAYRRAIEAGGSAQAWYWLGVAQINLEDANAGAAFVRATELQPSFGAAWRELGKVHLDANRPAEAVTALARAVGELPANAEAHYLHGMALLRNEKLEAATAALERAVELDPDHVEAKYNLALALRRAGDAVRSEELLAEVQLARRAADSGGSAALQQRGQMILRQGYARYRLGDPVRSLVLLNQAIEILPDNDLAHFYRGLALAQLERPAEALAALQAAIARNDSRPDTWQALAQLYELLGRTDEAAQATARLRELLQR
jgi:tetratricopeptide (TPR) repeat protein